MREDPLVIEGESDHSETPDWTPLEDLALWLMKDSDTVPAGTLAAMRRATGIDDLR